MFKNMPKNRSRKKLILPAAAALLLSAGMAHAETAAAPADAPAVAAEKAAPEGKPVVKRRPMLENMDRDQDGFVDAAEADEFTSDQFDQIDNNKDGFITAEEMDTYHHSRRGIWEKERKGDVEGAPQMPPEVEARLKARAAAHNKERFSSVDPDGDGKVTKEEFLKHAQERHKKMDLDGDGKVSREELKKLHEDRKEKRQDRREKLEQRKSEGKMSKPPVKDDTKAAPAE